MTKTALITGTTSGIGYELCHQFASNQTNLVLVSRCEAKLLKQKQDLEKLYGIQVEIISYDLTKTDAAESIIRQLNEKNLPIDYLVNNAGFNEVGSFLHTELDNELDMIQLHITFITKLTKYLLPGMIQQNYGRILNIASTGSYIPCPHNVVYTATKSYLLSFTKGLAAELENTGVTITAACPGATRTNFPKKAGLDQSLLFKYFVMDSKVVAARSYKALMTGKKVSIIGLHNKLLVLSSKLLPSRLINQVSLKVMS